MRKYRWEAEDEERKRQKALALKEAFESMLKNRVAQAVGEDVMRKVKRGVKEENFRQRIMLFKSSEDQSLV